MGRKALLAVVCCLLLNEELHAVKVVHSSVINDNVSEESAPRLYRNVPFGVYASAVPYGSFSFHAPSFISARKTAASRIIPVKENTYNQSPQAFLKDSYGKFVEAPQSAAYRTPFSPQFLQLQELPAHLAQPLVAPSFQFKQQTPQFYFGSQYKLPTFQAVTPTPIVTQFQGFGQPFGYAQNIRSLVPAATGLKTKTGFAPISQEQTSSSKEIYANTQAFENSNNLNNEPKFQRLVNNPQVIEEDVPKQHATQSEKLQIQAAPAKQSVTTIVNGEKTVINLETKPPIPLLDLTLLEPLTFDNPLVPQVQHFLPRINAATYLKLPQLNVNEPKKHEKDFVITKTKSYSNGNGKGKSKNEVVRKKQKKPAQDENRTPKKTLQTPAITVTKGTPDEFAYEINSPNYKEIYNEQVVSYNKKTQSEPENYSYNTQTQNKPVEYHYTHTSKEPAQNKEVHYHSNGQGPKHLVYKLKPEEQNTEGKHESSHSKTESDDSRESVDSDDESLVHKSLSADHEEKSSQDLVPEHREEEYHHEPSSEEHHNPRQHERTPNLHSSSEYHNSIPQHHSIVQSHGPAHHHHSSQHHTSQQHHPLPKQHASPQHHSSLANYNPPQHHTSQQQRDIPQHHSSLKHQNSKDHKDTTHNDPSSHQHPQQQYTLPQHHSSSQHYSSPQQNSNSFNIPELFLNQLPTLQFQPINSEYEENIHILPYKPNAAIKVDPSQHLKPHPAQVQPRQPQKFKNHQSSVHPRSNDEPVSHIREKTKQVLIKEEIPDDIPHIDHTEQTLAEMIAQQEKNEEDFEKSYKDAAYGFPAYDQQSEDGEKDIYNPESYGAPRDHSDDEIEHTPFDSYHDEGDDFPKATRSDYKDTRDKIKEEYVLDYSISKPQSYLDRFKKKENYFKMYAKQRPEKYFADDYGSNKKKQTQKEKYTLEPTYSFNVPKSNPKQFFAQYKIVPQKYEYDYSKEAPRDNAAHSTRSHQRHKSKTHFVEPQFQYGFEPLSIPRLLDSELAAMATNNSPEIEKPGTRKKIYKENWYIKKTTTTGGKPSS